MNCKELNELLSAKIKDVCKELFPLGKIQNGEYCVGSVCGESGKSLKICLKPSKLGIWSDFASGQTGSLIDLWMYARNITLVEAIKQAKAFCHIKEDNEYFINRQPKQVLLKRNYDDIESTEALRYLTETRKITSETLQRFRVASCQAGKGIAFLSYGGDPETIQMIKYLALDRDEHGKKKIWAETGSKKVLFGKHAVNPSHSVLVICEGELDAMSVSQCGYSAVSVPFGAKWETDNGSDPNQEWITNDWAFLENYNQIILFFDNDDSGQRAARSIYKRIGSHERCSLAKLEKYKDANEALVSGDTESILNALKFAEAIKPEELLHSKDFIEQVWEIVCPSSDHASGIPLLPNVDFMVRPKEVTVWTGFSGSGKSELLNCAMSNQAVSDQRICIASLEIAPEETLSRILRQTSGIIRLGQDDRPRFDKEFCQATENFWIYNRVGMAKWEHIIEVFDYARNRYGIDQFVVDSLMKCIKDPDDFAEQKGFVNGLADFVNKTGCHVHLVAHSRKKDDETFIPSKLDVAGTAAITDLAWNVMSVWRNKPKEIELREAKNNRNTSKIQELDGKPDTLVKCSKQRKTGVEDVYRFKFNRQNLVFTSMDAPANIYEEID